MGGRKWWWDARKEPLICIKPHVYLLRANTTVPLFSWFILMFQRMHTHTLQLRPAFKSSLTSHNLLLVSSSFSRLFPICSHRRIHYTYGKSQQQRLLAGKRPRDHKAQEHSWCNPVLHSNTGQVLFRWRQVKRDRQPDLYLPDSCTHPVSESINKPINPSINEI